MSIVPLPVFEADADPHHREARTDEEIYRSLEPPKTIVVRFGSMKNVGEYRHEGTAKPGCGTKLVARTHRGTEVVEMLTTTCENSGCSKSVTRQEMLEYIDRSGGKDYPFHRNGRVLRVATVEDLNKQSALDQDKPRYVKLCKALIKELNLPMKLVDVEPILGGELLTFYYMSEKRVDFRELVRQLAGEFKSRIEMRQVGARDEARLVADYERCGQHCCCQGFLKVLKPVSMKAAKLQKATLDPLKISGRCGRLMCCLRYEDQTYRELKKNLPRKATRVGTVEGPGVVVDGRVLVQLVLVRLEADNREIAVPVEELMDPDECPPPGAKAREDALRGMPPEEVARRTGDGDRARDRDRDRDRGGRKRRRKRGGGAGDPGTTGATGGTGGTAEKQDAFRARDEQAEGREAREGAGRRRRRKGPRQPSKPPEEGRRDPAAEGQSGEGPPRKKKRRRRRRRGGGGEKAES